MSECVCPPSQAIKVFLCHCWPVVPALSQILLQMFRLLCDITYKEETTRGEQDPEEQHIVNLSEECLILLGKIAPDETKALCSDIMSRAVFNQTFSTVTDRVFEWKKLQQWWSMQRDSTMGVCLLDREFNIQQLQPNTIFWHSL